MLNDKHAKEKLLDVSMLRGAVGGMFDHFLVETSGIYCSGFMKRGSDV